MSLSPSRVATMLDQTAALLAEHGSATTRRVHDLALGATHHTDGPGQRNSISDPTGNSALAPPDPLAGLEARWHRAHLAMQDMALEHTVLGIDTEACCRNLARITDGIAPKPLAELVRLCHELQHVMFETVPMDREQADEELREKSYLERRSECECCESPTGPAVQEGRPDTVLSAGLCRPGCYEAEKKQVQRGTYIDRATFVTNMRAGIARGEIYRPASPYWATNRPVIHEGDVA